MDAEDELRETIEAVKTKQAQQQAAATELRRAAEYKTTTDAAAAAAFVRTTLPEVVGELLPKVSTMANRPVRTTDSQPGNASDGDHQDWHYAFEVGQAAAVVDACGPTLKVWINKRSYQVSTPDRDAAIRLFTTVVKLGLA